MSQDKSNIDYSGMTGNERLWESGLMDVYERAKSKNLQQAYEILQHLNFDEESIRANLKIKHNIPKNILLNSFCNYYSTNAIKILENFKLTKQQINILHKKKRVDKIFLFSKNDLILYLSENEKVCDDIINESYDKRSTPSTFIKEENNDYIVGYYDKMYKDISIWNNKIYAVADYLFLSWNLKRL